MIGRKLRRGLGIGLVLGVAACATSPTGRNQLMLVSDSEMNSMGVQAFQDLKTKEKIETDPAVVNYVRCVATPVASLVSPIDKWEIVVFKSDQVNAFAFLGGKIGVYTGLLRAAKNQDQLAAVLGHEVGHVLARHGNERVSQAFATQIGMAALSTAVKDPDNKWLMVAALGAQVGILLPFSRTHESEADMIGLDLMSRAGFDPSQSVELWKNMKAAGGGQPPEFLSTHPSNDRRIHDLQQGIPEANLKYRKAREAGHVPNCRL
jgi:predicted Zn-dependent protease